MSKTPANAEQKQTTIVEAALKLFLQQGYGMTSMDQVAQRAGVTKQTVYRYYPSKQELFVAVMEKIRADEAAPHEFGRTTLRRELVGFGRRLLAFHLTPSALGVYKLMLGEGAKESLLGPFGDAGPRRIVGLLTEFLHERCPKLEDAAFHAEMFATMVLAPRNRLIMRGKGRVTRAAQHEHVNKVVRLFLWALPT